MIRTNSIEGHRHPVTCLDSHENLLISGSEDKTVRLWDLRDEKSKKALIGFENEIEEVKFCHWNSNIVISVAGKNIYSHDLRFDGIINKSPIDILNQQFLEINSFSISPKEKKIAFSDDSNSIYLYSMKENGRFDKKISNLVCHKNIVSSLCFSKDNMELVSGGFDFKCCRWDIINSKLIGQEEVNSLNLDGNQQLFNPPFIQTLRYFLEDKYIALGLGDGNLVIIDSKNFSYTTSKQDHNCMITSLFPNKNSIITGGTDGNIFSNNFLTECHHESDQELKIVNKIPKKNKKNKKSNKNKNSQKNSTHFKLEPNWTIRHGSKINYIQGIQYENHVDRIAVADLTNTISIYEAT